MVIVGVAQKEVETMETIPGNREPQTDLRREG